MLETQLQKLLISTIAAGIAAWPGVALPVDLIVQQAFQPRQEGIPTGPFITVYHKGPAQPRGFPKFRNYTDSNVLMREQRQRMESTYVIGGLIPQSPATPDALTEVDVLTIIRTIMQGTGTLNILNAQDVGVFRVTQVDSNYFQDDKAQNENNPMFSIVLTHSDVVTYPAPSITTVGSGIYPI